MHYQAFFIDAWGVLHDGASLYPGSLKCQEKFQALGKKVVILSNAARRRKAMIEELQAVGIEPELYHTVLSSGELAWKSLRDNNFQNQRGYYLGPPRSRGLLTGLKQSWVDDIESAEFILNAGAPEGNPSTTIDSEALLKKAVRRDLPMICANPDLIAIRGGQAGISAGALAKCYENLGASRIEYHGKPHTPVYQLALVLLDEIPASQVLAIGDAYQTDILGAQNAGLDACLIAAGIHRESLLPLSIESIQETAPCGILPDYASEYLTW